MKYGSMYGVIVYSFRGYFWFSNQETPSIMVQYPLRKLSSIWHLAVICSIFNSYDLLCMKCGFPYLCFNTKNSNCMGFINPNSLSTYLSDDGLYAIFIFMTIALLITSRVN